MKTILSIAAALGLAACTTTTAVADAAADGTYRVVAIDGAGLDDFLDLRLVVDATTITFPAACGGYGWTYQIEGTRIATSRRQGPSAECLARARVHHAVFDTAAAIDGASSMVHTDDRRLVIEGGGHTVMLFAQ
ncbi:hypothetical protein GRI62_12590 [Erythrobacter arachoides]|uniref:META domain-containing protein n=1 Tax=Aurantiacibacter arachoides TaxID=1850444 RepID=A0A845A403_9SPHN|nr:hypothetical protein [Aurantiacibacter arachoides]MXO94434.1 hypothetical protein [Aurantiacibacter arachoides]GGD63445.1 hypothetical protein GCM10011411_24740 [Aurantiacibacter arachoides]